MLYYLHPQKDNSSLLLATIYTKTPLKRVIFHYKDKTIGIYGGTVFLYWCIMFVTIENHLEVCSCLM